MTNDDPQSTPSPDERERDPAKPELAKVRLDVDLSIVTQAKLLGAKGAVSAAPQHTVRLNAIPAPRPASDTAANAAVPARSSAPPPRSNASTRPRYIPLAATAVACVAAVGLAAAHAQSAAEPEPAGERPVLADGRVATVQLAAATVPIGLSDDGKEVVLRVCHQLSDAPRVECTLQHLRDIGELPGREQEFGPLEVDAFEITNAQYDACVATGACVARDFEACEFYSPIRGRESRATVPDAMRGPSLPAICGDFAEAAAFCASRGARLPTADEWERAARSGDDRLQPWGRFVFPGLLNWGERTLRDFPIPGRVDGYELTAPVDTFRAGATDDGVFNMLGNVAEWVLPRDGDPEGSAGLRGGSYADPFLELRLTRHSTAPASARRSDVGFRCIR